MLLKNCKEGGNCHNIFLSYSQIHFIFFQKIKKEKNSKQCRFERNCFPFFPTRAEVKKKKDFENLFPSTLSLSLLTQPHRATIMEEIGDPCPGHHALDLDRVW
jgi:hypothetical protein